MERKHVDRLTSEAGNLPDRPGVYLFRDGDGDVLYVGKAKSLRARVRSYFTGGARGSVKVRELVRRIRDLETVVVDSEAEALLLEWNLIREHEPRFNIQLRDDKSYPYIKVTVQEPYPRVLVTRRLERDGSRYFGPFTDVGAMRSALRFVKGRFHVRSCHYDMPDEMPPRPCLDYHIGRCKAPCAGHQSREEYRQMIDRILGILSGRTGEVKEEVRREMEEASRDLDFERAAQLRDVLRGLEGLERQRTTIDAREEDLDVLGTARLRGLACGVLLRIREGRLLGQEIRYLRNVEDSPPEEVVEGFVKGFYLRRDDLPPQLVCPHDFPDRELVEEYLSLRREGRFRIHVPSRGRKRRLVELARENAGHSLRQDLGSTEDGAAADRREAAAVGDGDASGAGGAPVPADGTDAPRVPAPARVLARELDLPEPARSLVAFDVSTLQGTDSVGSAVWLRDGRPVKDEYRRFRIRGGDEGRPDDYAMMQEIVSRYFHRRVREGHRLPDLVVVDGGKGQLQAARQAMESAGASDVPVVSLAKRDEEIFVPGRSGPVRLDRAHPGLHWLQRARDEAHRFALAYNRKLRRRRTLRSRLSEVPGVGPVREQRLLRRFGSLEAVRNASLEELAETSGIGPQTAARILERLDGVHREKREGTPGPA